VTREGIQEYESPGWMNGHQVVYEIPAGIKIHALKYRETGYDCEFSGYFSCSDNFYNQLWQKANRTLYVTMRDTYMDCPDRERAPYWGDIVNESGEAFYAMSTSASLLTRKCMLELIRWQRSDSTLYSPVPSGNWNRELPGQMLASVGHFGFWNYYMNTGDRETMVRVYEGVQKYLAVWRLKEDGTLVKREGDWYWGDWGREIDRLLLLNAWYYLALKGYANMSELLGRQDEAEASRKAMEAFSISFNSAFWDGTGYRTRDYEGRYDDRAQALAVVSGLADKEKYPALTEIFKNSFLASPYMEKYVLEALFIMGEAEYGLQRMKDRFRSMVEGSGYTTLYENFGTGDQAGYGTNNHAWSGGGLTILSQYVCGLSPLEPGWKTFRVRPQPGSLTYARAGNETVAGPVSVFVNQDKSSMKIKVNVPGGTASVVCIPVEYETVAVNGQKVFYKTDIPNELVQFAGMENGYNQFRAGPGDYTFSAR